MPELLERINSCRDLSSLVRACAGGAAVGKVVGLDWFGQKCLISDTPERTEGDPTIPEIQQCPTNRCHAVAILKTGQEPNIRGTCAKNTK